MNKISVLNLGGGKLSPIGIKSLENYFLVNVDTMYFKSEDLNYINNQYKDWIKESKVNQEYFYNSNVSNFLDLWLYPFDLITMYRFIEHIKREDILYLIYQLSTVTNPGSEIDVIVPNYVSLANRIINEDPFSKDFVKEDIITSTELFNEPDMPHCSIWTPSRAKYYFELEERFRIIKMQTKYEFDGRDIYMKFIAIRK